MQDLESLPKALQRQALNKLRLLKTNLAHPSLRVKRVQGAKGLYEGSVNMSYRFLFRIVDDRLVLERIGPHKILDEI